MHANLLLLLSMTASVKGCLYSPPGPLLPSPSNTCASPIDDTTPDHSPWSHPPQCLRTPSTLSNITSTYCLYTLPSNSTSIITTPETASSLSSENIFSLPPTSAFQRPPLPLHNPLSLPPSRSSSSQSPDPDLELPYRIAPVKHKGLGLLATRTLKRGEVFMVETPTLLLDVRFLRDAKAHHRRRLVKRALGRLGEEVGDRVMGLSRREGAAKGYEIDAVLGVNAVAVPGPEMGDGDEEGDGFMGLFMGFSRINHDCRPNALYRFSPRTLTLEIFPYRTIQPGEEITVSYTPISLPRSQRLTYLREVWNITCTCPVCALSTPELISDSDHRRSRIEELRQSVLQASEEEYFENALVMAHEWLDIAEKEGLPPLMAEWYDVVTRLSFDTGDLAGARRYAILAVDAWWRLGSVDGTMLEKARGWLRELGRLRGDVRLPKRGIGNMFGDVKL